MGGVRILYLYQIKYQLNAEVNVIDSLTALKLLALKFEINIICSIINLRVRMCLCYVSVWVTSKIILIKILT